MRKLSITLLIALLVGCSGPQVPVPTPKPDTPVKPVDKPAKPSKETKTEVVKKGETVKQVEEPVKKGESVTEQEKVKEADSKKVDISQSPILDAQGWKGGDDLHLMAMGFKPFNKSLIGTDSINKVDKYGMTPLHIAAGNNPNIAIVKAFIDAGADINAKDNYGFTPLMHAVKTNTYEVIKLLCDRKADVKAESKAGRAAIDLFFNRFEDEEDAISKFGKQNVNNIKGWLAPF